MVRALLLKLKINMPEGPSIIILKEHLQSFKEKKILAANGNANIDMTALNNHKIIDFKSWGKHTLICLPHATIKIHLLMFGSYSINEQIKADKFVRLHLKLKNGDIYFYSCSVKIIEEDLNEMYDWSADVMSEQWSAKKAIQKLKKIPDQLICDALLNQDIFAGVGNIIKNEVLFLTSVHPKSLVGNIPAKKITSIVNTAQTYSFDFLRWKKAFELKKHWLAHTKKTCTNCGGPIFKEYLGTTQRRSFFCNNCQVIY